MIASWSPGSRPKDGFSIVYQSTSRPTTATVYRLTIALVLSYRDDGINGRGAWLDPEARSAPRETVRGVIHGDYVEVFVGSAHRSCSEEYQMYADQSTPVVGTVPPSTDPRSATIAAYQRY